MSQVVYSRSKELEMTYARINVPALLYEGKFSYLVGNEWVSQDVFDMEFPVPLYVKPNKSMGENPCKKYSWMK